MLTLPRAVVLSSSGDEGFELVMSLLVIVGAIALVIFIGIFMVPAVVVGGGATYYFRNHYFPKRQEAKKSKLAWKLYNEATSAIPTQEKFSEMLAVEGFDNREVLEVAVDLYILEGLELPDKPPIHADSIEGARYRDQLNKFLASSAPQHFNKFLRELKKGLHSLEQGNDEGGIFTSRASRTPQEVENLLFAFIERDGCFRDLTEMINVNFNEQNGVVPSKYKGNNCAWDYLKDTPLLKLEYIEKRVGLTNRTYHTHLLGASGSGKSNLIEFLMEHDVSSNDCCAVLIDSQVQIIPRLAQINLPTDEVTYISPNLNLALNLFDVGYDQIMSKGNRRANNYVPASIHIWYVFS